MTNEFEVFISGQQFKKIFEKEYEKIMDTYNLRKIELDILYFLSNCGPYDTAKDIANIRYISKAHISSAVENLTRRTYIGAREDELDRRCVHLSIMEPAKPIVDQMAEIRNQIFEIAYQGVSEEERRVMQTIIKKIAYNLQQEILKK